MACLRLCTSENRAGNDIPAVAGRGWLLLATLANASNAVATDRQTDERATRTQQLLRLPLAIRRPQRLFLSLLLLAGFVSVGDDPTRMI